MNFALGAVITGLLFVAIFTTKPVEEHWRQCAPAQAGEQLVSSVQYEDKTECFYQKMERIRRHSVTRKEQV
jgi:hypothetical protein